MSRNFYALGHQDDDDPMYHVGKLSGGVFTWAMDRLRCESVLAGLAEKHCKTCTCTPFALQFVEAASEDRTLVGAVFC